MARLWTGLAVMIRAGTGGPAGARDRLGGMECGKTFQPGAGIVPQGRQTFRLMVTPMPGFIVTAVKNLDVATSVGSGYS